MQLTEHRFTTWDGASLFYRAWKPDINTDRFVLMFHRGHEHSGRYHAIATRLVDAGAVVFACDQRGHGLSDGARGCAPNLAAITRDAECFARYLVQSDGLRLEKTAVIAVSLGAVVATAWVHDYAPPICGLLLLAAAFEVKLYIPFAIPFLRIKEFFLPGGKVKSFVKASMLSNDPVAQKQYDADPLIFREIAVNMLLDLHDAGKRLVADAGAVVTPTLIIVAGKDWVVKPKPQFRFYRQLGSSVKQLEFVRRGKHALLHDVVSREITPKILTFIDQCWTGNVAVDATQADRGGASRVEYDLLKLPSSLMWKGLAAFVRLGGLFSNGIKLGGETGFDSGHTLDYVYANQAAGRTILGKLIDRIYLDAIGWRGIRVRRTHLEELLGVALQSATDASLPLRIVDIASGPGRYLLEMLRDWKGKPIEVELRDYRQSNLDTAAAMVRQSGLSGVTLRLADAFDANSYADTQSKFSIAIISGLFELFPENDGPCEAICHLNKVMAEGGYLIYTCQPWHPQVEFIARTLNNREGLPWIMRRRSQNEMDALVRQAGFEKIDQRIDPWGIFTVSLARRVRS